MTDDQPPTAADPTDRVDGSAGRAGKGDGKHVATRPQGDAVGQQQATQPGTTSTQPGAAPTAPPASSPGQTGSPQPQPQANDSDEQDDPPVLPADEDPAAEAGDADSASKQPHKPVKPKPAKPPKGAPLPADLLPVPVDPGLVEGAQGDG
ncbi:MAG: hypothetical protein HOQ45_07940 [Nocardioidaceae bacterium]|nr:hypothetical protein [Nocardioidaceae bacterium]